jgi:Ca2+-transporting ATPase
MRIKYKGGNSMTKIIAPWAMDKLDVQDNLNSDIIRGLDSAESEKRLEEAGLNRITQSGKITFLDILLDEVKEPLIMLLLIIGVVYSIWGKIGDTVTIIFVILTVSLVEVYTEYRAKKSIESLKKLALPTTWIMREGKSVDIETSSIVPGDVLILKNGVKVSADARVFEAQGLEADESQLTGESMGVSKISDTIAESCGLHDRSNMVHMGSVILKGKGLAMVVNTGMNTELGRIAGLTQEAREPKTPLQKSMKQLSKNLIWIAAVFSILIPLLGVLRGMPLQVMILTGLSLAFATIPEEMPIIVTMLLGLGAITLSRRNVLIRRTKAAETLGSVTVIATDKTGTLTENKMSIERWYAKDEELLFTIGALMADVAYDSGGGFLGDPMDRSVAEKAEEFHLDSEKIKADYSLVKDLGFDEDRKIFRATYKYGNKIIHTLKGAPESVFSLAEQDIDMEKHFASLLDMGYRTIALALKEEFAEKYTLLGLISFEDPIREGVREAIEECSKAGVKVIMITGDHASVAERISGQAGIAKEGLLTGEEIQGMTSEELRSKIRENNIYARISPEQKLKIVSALHENGEVVAVTGDGINDAPALKAADIGISMGISGTDVAKETADMILTNDSFTSISEAIREGRRLYDNLSKCVKYYLACKVGLIITFLVPILFNMPLPFSPIQIIILELFMDLAASTSFVVEPAETDLLKRKPRNPKENFMNKHMLSGIFSGGMTLAAAVLVVYLYFWLKTANLGLAQTYAFVTWLLGHVALAFNMRTDHVPLSKVGIFSSKAFNIWMFGVVAFLALALNVPLLIVYLKLSSVRLLPVAGIALMVLFATSWIEMCKHFSGARPLLP